MSARSDHRTAPRRRQGGQASVEYVAGLLFFIGVLIALPDGAVAGLLATLKQFYSNFSYLLSTP